MHVAGHRPFIVATHEAKIRISDIVIIICGSVRGKEVFGSSAEIGAIGFRTLLHLIDDIAADNVLVGKRISCEKALLEVCSTADGILHVTADLALARAAGSESKGAAGNVVDDASAHRARATQEYVGIEGATCNRIVNIAENLSGSAAVEAIKGKSFLFIFYGNFCSTVIEGTAGNGIGNAGTGTSPRSKEHLAAEGSALNGG